MAGNSRCLYNNSFETFLSRSTLDIFGDICDNYHGDVRTTSREAWKDEISIMKDTLLFAMDQLEYSEMPAGDLTIKIKKNGGQAPLTITGDVPDNMTKVTIEPDNAKIRAFLKDQPDNACEWAKLEERGRHIEIK